MGQQTCRGGSNIQVFPPEGFNGTQVSARVCYANCDFCQVADGACEECYAPFFNKGLDGSCIFNENYTVNFDDIQLESTVNEFAIGQGFTPSRSWPDPNRVRTCSANLNLKILGYFATETVSYRRTISSHRYIAIKFQLIAVNWTENSNVTIKFTDNNNQELCSKTIRYSATIPKCTFYIIQSPFARVQRWTRDTRSSMKFGTLMSMK